MFKTFVLAAVLAGFSSFAVAQFDGPTPLAWRWVPSTDYSPDGAPLVVGDRVYVAAGTRMYALDVHTGNEVWKCPLDGAKGNFRVQPVLCGDTVVDLTDAGYFYAADVKDGSVKWQYQMRPERRISALGQPVGVGSLLVFKQSDDSLNALNTGDGQPAWPQTIHVDTGFNGPLLVHDSDIIFANNNNEMYSINAVSQKVNWRQRFGFLPPDLSPVIYGDNMYLYSGEYLACVNVARGSGRWQINLDQNMEFGPAVSSSGICCVTDEGNVYFFDTNGHRTAMREVIKLGSGPSAQPSAVGSKFLVPTNNGALNLIDPTTGNILWSYAVHPIQKVADKKGAGPISNNLFTVDPRILTVPAAGPAVLDGNTMLVMCTDASLLAFDSKLGVDLTPPTVDMLWPRPGMQINGQPPLDLIWKVADEATGVNTDTLKIMLDGKPMKYTIGRDGVAVAHISDTGDNPALEDGRRVFTITVSDWIGNVTTKTFSIGVDNQLPPLNTPDNLKPSGGKGRGKGGGVGGGGGGIG